MKVFVLSALALFAHAASVVYVSPFGVDTASGGSMSNPFLTVPYAVGQVSPNGVVYLLTGAYTDFSRISKNVTISSYPTTMNPSQFVFNAQGRSNYFTVSAAVTFHGITFIGTSSSMGIIYVDPSGAGTIINCVFKQNSNAVNVAGQLTMTDTAITIDNSLSSSYAVSVPYSSGGNPRTSVYLYQVNVTGVNNSTNGNFGVYIQDQAQVNIQESNFINLGYGLRVSMGSFSGQALTVTLTNTYYTNCMAGTLMGSASGGGATLRIQGCAYNNNGVIASGSGLQIGGGVRAVIQDTLFSGNTASQQGGAIYCSGTSSLNVANSIFTNNKAPNGAAGWCSSTCAFLGTGLSGHGNEQTQNSGSCSMP